MEILSRNRILDRPRKDQPGTILKNSKKGFTCLIQISTRSADYIVDTLALRSELHKLNTVTTDPNICKVFHGGQSDVNWLQKDFGVYLVNCFDTFFAAQKVRFIFLTKRVCWPATSRRFFDASLWFLSKTEKLNFDF